MVTDNSHHVQFQLAPRVLKPLFKIQSWRHALGMVFDWSMIVVAIVCCLLAPHPLMYFLAVLVIGARMHALAILMHDATHFRFLKNRKWNDLISNVFIMYPLFSSIAVYRQNHLRHHQHLNTEHDPDWVAKLGKSAFTFPKTKREFIGTVLSYLFLYQGLKDAVWFLRRFQTPSAKVYTGNDPRWPKLIFNIVLLTTLTLTGTWLYYLLFWVVPYLSTFFMYQYIRSVAEHYGELAYEDPLTSTRTVRAKWYERFLLAPHQVAYHLEHHLYPGVPYYHLPRLHALLMETATYRDRAHITEGYLTGLLSELSSRSTATAQVSAH